MGTLNRVGAFVTATVLLNLAVAGLCCGVGGFIATALSVIGLIGGDPAMTVSTLGYSLALLTIGIMTVLLIDRLGK
ncbi:MAG TPA: hypothetical protein VFQ60_03995 [Patescibacteria group bacterium]|nr:hypothetical protein [Patescibacteria group bacterium]